MTTVVTGMRAAIQSFFAVPPRYDAPAEWARLVKRTVARYARGNIAAQNERILMPDEQVKERAVTRPIADAWRVKYAAIQESKPAEKSALR